MEPPGRAEDDVVLRGRGRPGSRRECAPTSRRGSPPRRRPGGEQLADRAVAERGAGQVPVERVVEVQQALVPQPHHDDGGDRLADRAEPVLDVGVRLGHSAATGRPGEPAVPDHPGDQARCLPLALRTGGARQEGAGGGREDGFRHARDRSETAQSSAGRAARTACWPGSCRCGWPAARTRPWPAAARSRPAPAPSSAATTQHPARHQGDDHVRATKIPPVDRAEDLDAQFGGLRDVLHEHADQQAHPGRGLGDGDDAERGGGGTGSHRPILPDGSAQVGPPRGEIPYPTGRLRVRPSSFSLRTSSLNGSVSGPARRPGRARGRRVARRSAAAPPASRALRPGRRPSGPAARRPPAGRPRQVVLLPQRHPRIGTGQADRIR